MIRNVVKTATLGVAVVLLAAQLIQPERSNPPVDPSASFEAVAKPPQQIAAMIGRSCRDCHSHETTWPWYSRISPISWLVAQDVKAGRSKLNFSQWNIYGPEMTRIKYSAMCEEVSKGEMPPPYYVPMHPDAKVSRSEMTALCATPVASRAGKRAR